MLAEVLPRLRLYVPPAGQILDPFEAFDQKPNEIWLEIGFGSGEHLVGQAQGHPGAGLIGCEAYVNGIAALLARIERLGLKNIRVFSDDARVLLPALAEASIARVFLLFPDPWPKKRHWNRRFVNSENVEHLARSLADRGELRIASDDNGFIRWTLQILAGHPAFRWTAESPADWRTPPADWIPTRYQMKAAEAGRKAKFLRFERRARHA